MRRLVAAVERFQKLEEDSQRVAVEKAEARIHGKGKKISQNKKNIFLFPAKQNTGQSESSGRESRSTQPRERKMLWM